MRNAHYHMYLLAFASDKRPTFCERAESPLYQMRNRRRWRAPIESFLGRQQIKLAGSLDRNAAIDVWTEACAKIHRDKIAVRHLPRLFE